MVPTSLLWEPSGFEDKFNYIQVGEEQLVLIIPCNHEPAKRRTVKLVEAISTLSSTEETSGTRQEIEKLLKDNNIPCADLKVAFEMPTESVVTAVSEGRGVSIISSIATAKAQAAGLVKAVAILEARDTRKLYIARHKKALIKPCEAFWEFCKNYKFKSEAIACQS